MSISETEPQSLAEANGLRDAQAADIATAQNRMMLGAGNASQKSEGQWHCLGLFLTGMILLKIPLLLSLLERGL